MALLSTDEEMARAALKIPFSNGFEAETWTNLWCEDGCIFYNDCPLITVAIMNRTPAAWILREPGGLNKYTCTEYSDASQATQEIR